MLKNVLRIEIFKKCFVTIKLRKKSFLRHFENMHPVSCFEDIMTILIKTLLIMTSFKKTLLIMTLLIMTLLKKTLLIMTLRKKTLLIMTLLKKTT